MKRVLAVCLILLSLFSLSACKKSKGEFEFTSTETVIPQATSSNSKYNDDFFKNDISVSSAVSSQNENNSNISSSSVSTNNDKVNPDLNGWYFKNLSVEQKRIYKVIDTAVYNMKSGYINLGKSKYEDVLLSFKAVLYDRPEYFWLNNEYILKVDKSKKEYSIGLSGVEDKKIEYLCSESQRLIMETEMESAFVEIKKLTASATSDYQKELMVHNWLIDKITYDTETIESHKNDSIINPFSFTAYGGLVSKRSNGKTVAVCEGYSKAFQYILKRLGIESVLISGKYDGVGHMWNAVKIEDKWYNVDLTANDTGDEGAHFFFNVTDKAISKTHTKDKDFYDSSIKAIEKGEYNLFSPACKTNTYNYFYLNDLFINDLNTVVEFISKKILENESAKKIEFAFSDSKNNFYNATTIYEKIKLEEVLKKIEADSGKQLSLDVFGIENSKAFIIKW